MTRLGSKLPFEQAAEEVWLSQGTRVEASTLRGTTHRYGQLAEAVERAEAERIARERPEAAAEPEQLFVSADGSYIHLTSGEWREVKTMVIGQFETLWQEKAGEIEVKSKNLSYFSRSYRIREFEQYALAECHRRGVDNARLVVTVNDGSDWIDSLADYHFPQARRILDFRHATDYLVAAGKAAFGQDSEQLSPWLARMTHQLKHKPPQQTLADLALLAAQAETEEEEAIIEQARRYLQKRQKRIDYPYFLARGLPIGSGSVESSHKLVVHSRLKQAGMRWAESHVDPMLALRNLVCNGRWSPGWSQIVAHYWQQRHQEFRDQAKRQRPHSPPISLAALKTTPISASAQPTEPLNNMEVAQQSYRPAPDHPWKRGIWPTKEAWRWN